LGSQGVADGVTDLVDAVEDGGELFTRPIAAGAGGHAHLLVDRRGQSPDRDDGVVLTRPRGDGHELVTAWGQVQIGQDAVGHRLGALVDARFC